MLLKRQPGYLSPRDVSTGEMEQVQVNDIEFMATDAEATDALGPIKEAFEQDPSPEPAPSSRHRRSVCSGGCGDARRFQRLVGACLRLGRNSQTQSASSERRPLRGPNCSSRCWPRGALLEWASVRALTRDSWSSHARRA